MRSPIRLVKITTFSILFFILFIAAELAVIVNFVLTPERMTPMIKELMQEHFNTEIEISKVDFSIFSTLPKVSVAIDSLRIKNLAQGEDDLFSVDRCMVTMTPQSILRKQININEILLKRPSINLYVDSLVRPMAHVKINSTETTIESDTTSQFNLGDYRFRLDSVRIDSAHLVVNDVTKRFYSSIDNMSMGVKLRISPKRIMVMSNIDLDRFNTRLNNETYSSNLSLNIDSKLVYKPDSTLLRISDTRFSVNGINMMANGIVKSDEESGETYMDIHSSLETPTLMEFIDLIPSKFLPQKDSLSTKGSVALDLNINGKYSDKEMPICTGNIKIDNALVHYGTNPISLDRFDCDANMLIDFNTKKNSYAKIKNLHINTSGIIDMSIKGDMTDIIESPYIDVDFNSDIDFDRISEIVPLPAGVTVSGRNINKLHTQFRLTDIEQSNYGKLYIDGESKFQKLKIDIDGSKFSNDSTATTYFAVNVDEGSLLFGDKVKANNSRTLLSTMVCSGFGFKDRDGTYTSIKDIKVTMGANFNRATQKVNGMGVNAVMQSINAGIENEIDVDMGATNMTLAIAPKTEDHNTKVFAKVNSQSIAVDEKEFNSSVLTQMVNAELNMTRKDDKKWHLSGWTGFESFEMYSDLFPIKTSLHDSRMTIEGDKIELEGANVSMGESKFVATGYTSNVIRSMFFDPTVHIDGKLNIKSSILNANELMDATNKSVMMAETTDETGAEIQSDTTNIMLLVPRNTTFEFNMDVDKVIFGNSYIDNMLGLATIKDGVLSLDKLTFKAIEAKTLSSIKYYNIDKNNSNLYMNVNLQGANINRIGELLPSITQMMPMMEALEGNVDFYLKAKMNVDKGMNIDFDTFRASSSMNGRRLVLMDKETFDDVAKTLMFKNKDRNLINSLQIYMTAEKNKFTVLPFELNIDRYKMVIGGDQFVTPISYDLDYEYNISIIKSPLPFKAGVDIKGRNENFDHKITKAKLKNSDFKAIKKQYTDFRDSIKE